MPRRDSVGASVCAAPEGCQAMTTSGRSVSVFSTFAFMPSPTRGMAFAAAGKSLLDTVPTILSPAPAAKISSVMCGARVMARAAGALVCAASAARAGLPYAGPACAGSGTREVAQAPAAKQHAASPATIPRMRRPEFMRLHTEREVHKDIGTGHVVAIHVGVIPVEQVVPAYLHPHLLTEVVGGSQVI